MGPLVLTDQQYFNRADVLVARKTLLDVNIAADSDAVPLLRLPVKSLILHNPTRCSVFDHHRSRLSSDLVYAHQSPRSEQHDPSCPVRSRPTSSHSLTHWMLALV